MDSNLLFLYAMTMTVAVATPGLNVIAIVTHTLAYGYRRALGFVAGTVTGDFIWLTLAIAGLAAIAQNFYEVFVALRIISVLYLLYTSWKLWTSPPLLIENTSVLDKKSFSRLYFSGLSLSLSNPALLIFYMAILPTFLDLGKITFLEAGSIFLIMSIVLFVVLGSYIALAGKAQTFFKTPKAQLWLNRLTSIVLFAAAIAVSLQLF